MSAFAEFLWLAAALYLWECLLWVPLWSTPLRKSRRGWRALNPRSWFATRHSGVVPQRPLLSDAGFAPCLAPVLLPVDQGQVLHECAPGDIRRIALPDWRAIRHDGRHIQFGPLRVAIGTPRFAALLKRAKARGADPAQALQRINRLSLSPARASREWVRWRQISSPMRSLQWMLTLGFFAGLPLAYIHMGTSFTLMVGLWLWSVMLLIAIHLWWLGKRVYRDARSALWMDALLSLIIPFHAMRASGIAAVHAMGTTHPAALILSDSELANPWWCAMARKWLHPSSRLSHETAHAAAMAALLERPLRSLGRTLADFDRPPHEASGSNYCPRCHAIYQPSATHCHDCHELPLRKP